MKSYMDADVDPCQDFYQYACGNWESLHGNVQKYVDTIGSLDYTINQRMKIILRGRKMLAKFERNEIYRKVREYLQSCEEQKKFDAKYYLEVEKPWNELKWPEEGELWSAEGKWDIWSTLGKLQLVGFNGFPWTLELRHHNATHFRLELDKMDNLGYTAYEQSLVDRLENSLNPEHRQLAENIQIFMTHLATLHMKHRQIRNEELPLKDLSIKVQNVNFLKYFTVILDSEEQVENLNITITNLDFFRHLGDLVEETSEETLIHTLKIKFLGYMEKQMPKVDMSLYCMHHMRDLVPLALDYIYEQEVYRFHRKTTDAVIKKVFQNMQQKFVEIIEEHEQEFSHAAMELLKAKILKMKLNIGNLPTASNHSFYFEYFQKWQVTPNDFYRNHINALRHYQLEKFKLLQLKVLSPYHSFFIWPYGSPAFQPSANLLIIPHAYLRFPLFHPRFHDLFLYAELGNTLGHEIIHAFDVNGLKYDAEGNPTASLIASLPDEFFQSLECLNQQRSESLNEKIADISGFRLAYDTYFQNYSDAEFQAPIELTNKQLFFIKFAQFFCAISPKHISYDNSHDTPFLRVPQVVANHQDFEMVFNCSSKNSRSKLKKCNLW
ncbi:endothelin-converting enzyme 1-like [Haematobia irritans]|uniref:endothelin-converting enzyme 1-like n=1 Tax=Haematobia irritans TaxID=7368 RepID=UPI003F4FED24